jgi:hypothetical protein
MNETELAALRALIAEACAEAEAVAYTPPPLVQGLYDSKEQGA